MSYLYKLVKVLSVCLCVCVWMLTRLAKIATAAQRHLHRHINEPLLHNKNWVSLAYFTGKNRPPKKWAWHFQIN